MQKKLEKLTKCELRVMVIIWSSKKELSMQHICAEVNRQFDTKWKTQTVSTFLARLVKKGFLSMVRKGRVFYYTPLVTKEEYIENTIPKLFKLLGIRRNDALSSNWWD